MVFRSGGETPRGEEVARVETAPKEEERERVKLEDTEARAALRAEIERESTTASETLDRELEGLQTMVEEMVGEIKETRVDYQLTRPLFEAKIAEFEKEVEALFTDVSADIRKAKEAEAAGKNSGALEAYASAEIRLDDYLRKKSQEKPDSSMKESTKQKGDELKLKIEEMKPKLGAAFAAKQTALEKLSTSEPAPTVAEAAPPAPVEGTGAVVAAPAQEQTTSVGEAVPEAPPSRIPELTEKLNTSVQTDLEIAQKARDDLKPLVATLRETIGANVDPDYQASIRKRAEDIEGGIGLIEQAIEKTKKVSELTTSENFDAAATSYREAQTLFSEALKKVKGSDPIIEKESHQSSQRAFKAIREKATEIESAQKTESYHPPLDTLADLKMEKTRLATVTPPAAPAPAPVPDATGTAPAEGATETETGTQLEKMTAEQAVESIKENLSGMMEALKQQDWLKVAGYALAILIVATQMMGDTDFQMKAIDILTGKESQRETLSVEGLLNKFGVGTERKKLQLDFRNTKVIDLLKLAGDEDAPDAKQGVRDFKDGEPTKFDGLMAELKKNGFGEEYVRQNPNATLADFLTPEKLKSWQTS